MITGKQNLPLFASKDEIAQTSETKLPSIYPLKPTLDLKEVNEYEWETRYRKNCFNYCDAFLLEIKFSVRCQFVLAICDNQFWVPETFDICLF